MKKYSRKYKSKKSYKNTNRKYKAKRKSLKKKMQKGGSQKPISNLQPRKSRALNITTQNGERVRGNYESHGPPLALTINTPEGKIVSETSESLGPSSRPSRRQSRALPITTLNGKLVPGISESLGPIPPLALTINTPDGKIVSETSESLGPSSRPSRALTITTPAGEQVMPGTSKPRRPQQPQQPVVEQIGIVINQYLTRTEYESTPKVYSDHAPIKYVIPDSKTIIIWNIGQWGCLGPYKDSNLISISTIEQHITYTYNHKFNGLQLETLEQYKTRLTNIAEALAQMQTENLDVIFLIQELPIIISEHNMPFAPPEALPIFYKNLGYNPSDPSDPSIFTYEKYNEWITECLEHFNAKLKEQNLMIVPRSIGYGSSMIINNSNNTFISFMYQPRNIEGIFDVITNDVGMHAFQDISNPSILYVSTHIKYKAYYNPETLTYTTVDKLMNILNIYKRQIEKYNSENPVSSSIKKIYFCGDFNRSVDVVGLSSYKIYTTIGNKSYSLKNNNGELNIDNIDLILEMNL